MTLTPERLGRVRQLFEAALEHPAGARAGFLEAAAPDDPGLVLEVTELLAAYQAGGDTFEHPLPAQLGLQSPTLVGNTIGPYRVVRQIGHGGMGSVYEGVREDGQVRMRVAIKTLLHAADRGAARERFRREGRIQSGLTHPNIATLLDAGVTEAGLPYIVLEYVDGVPLDRYCEQHRLDLDARLDLFRQVGQAVQHAHGQLVVHRDLKPGNILVTGNGVVKLLDFGISKLLDDTVDPTMTDGARAFTAAYAAPEQVRGEPVSIATDVYALGLVLYRILAGRPAFDLDQVSPPAALAIICDQLPLPPSAAATETAARSMGFGSVDRLRRALRGELDAIVMMAIRKEPERRYPTADALCEDLLRYLKRLPVHARPDSAGYRVRKLIGRNRLTTAALFLAFLAMGAGLIAARAQARHAEQARAQAERVAGFLQRILSAGDRSWQGSGTPAQASIGEVVDRLADRIDVDLAGEPAVAEALHRTLAAVYLGLFQPTQGRRHAERWLALLRARGAPGVEIARALHDLGAHLHLGGKHDSALVVLEEAYRLFEEAGFPRTEDFAVTLNQLGIVFLQLGRPAEAERVLSRGVDLIREVGTNPVTAAIGSSNLGLILDARGDLDGAERRFRDAEAIYADIHDREYFERGSNLNNLALILLLKGDIPAAEQSFHKALEIWERQLGPSSLVVGLGRINLARAQLALGRPDSALETIRAGRAILGRQLPPGHVDHSRADIHEAAILMALGRLEDAERLARRGVATRTAAYPAGDWRIAEADGILGRVLVTRGAREEGRVLLVRSRDAMARAMGPGHPRTRVAELALSATESAPE